MIKVAMIGFGGIAKSAHLPPYLTLENKEDRRILPAFFYSYRSISIF